MFCITRTKYWLQVRVSDHSSALQYIYLSTISYLNIRMILHTKAKVSLPTEGLLPCTKPHSHRMIGFGRDLCGSSSSTPLLKQGHQEQAAQDLVQAGLEYLQRRRIHKLPGQPVPVLRHPQSAQWRSSSSCSAGTAIKEKCLMKQKENKLQDLCWYNCQQFMDLNFLNKSNHFRNTRSAQLIMINRQTV